jgi:hypothetical protein
MFDSMGGGLGEFFQRMQGGGFLDLGSRKGKAGGGFCTSFPTHGMPFVYANFNGTKGDVEVLTHEIGHAFQCYSSRDLWPMDYHWPTYESCEVHSMGGDDADVQVIPDPTPVLAKLGSVTDALEAFDRGIVSPEYVRAQMGADDQDAPDGPPTPQNGQIRRLSSDRTGPPAERPSLPTPG